MPISRRARLRITGAGSCTRSRNGETSLRGRWGRRELRGFSLAEIIAASFETPALAAMAGLIDGSSRADKRIED